MNLGVTRKPQLQDSSPMTSPQGQAVTQVPLEIPDQSQHFSLLNSDCISTCKVPFTYTWDNPTDRWYALAAFQADGGTLFGQQQRVTAQTLIENGVYPTWLGVESHLVTEKNYMMNDMPKVHMFKLVSVQGLNGPIMLTAQIWVETHYATEVQKRPRWLSVPSLRPLASYTSMFDIANPAAWSVGYPAKYFRHKSRRKNDNVSMTDKLTGSMATFITPTMDSQKPGTPLSHSAIAYRTRSVLAAKHVLFQTAVKPSQAVRSNAKGEQESYYVDTDLEADDS